MQGQSPRSSKTRQQPASLEGRMQQLNLDSEAQGETPESLMFRALPQAIQRRLLLDYPRILATAIHQYSEGANCEEILLQAFNSSSDMLRVRNSDGDNPVASALLRQQGERAEKLLDIAASQNPEALDDRSQSRETMLMLSTSSGSSAEKLMERLLVREPTQLHRLYDNNGRNFLHHCAQEESVGVLEAGLRITRTLIEEGRLVAGQVAAAIHMNDRAGDTVLHLMATRDRTDMLSLLLDFATNTGINVNLDERQHRGNRWTPLMSAVNAGAVRAARFLLDNGADPLEEDSKGVTVAEMAAATGSPELSELFREGVADGLAAAAGSDPLEPEAAAAGEAAPWMTQGPPVRTVDSGMGTTGELQQQSAAATPAPVRSLSTEEQQHLVRSLTQRGKELAFVEAFTRSHADTVTLARMSEKPIESLITSLAHEPGFSGLIQQALCSIGAEDLLA